ncbi:alpha-hydroxy-acid oxidizing protein [Prescottella agglutinans]
MTAGVLLRAEYAVRAVDLGLDSVVVSNHGSRRLNSVDENRISMLVVTTQ